MSAWPFPLPTTPRFWTSSRIAQIKLAVVIEMNEEFEARAVL